MIITLKRVRRKPVRNIATSNPACECRETVIDGHLLIDGICICDTAENAQGALPAGIYQIDLAKCHQYARKMILVNSFDRNCSACPMLSSVKNDTPMPCICPMLKVGNGVFNRHDGSIILGEHICPGCLMHSKPAFDALYDRIRKSLQRKNIVQLIIIDTL